MKIKKLLFGTLLFFSLLWMIYTVLFVKHTPPLLNGIVRSLVYAEISEAEQELLCYEQETSLKGFLEFNEQTDIADFENYIFFHETSCKSFKETQFDARQACAVESAAYYNPNKTVFLLFLSPWTPNVSARLLIKRLSKYANIRIRRLRIQNYLADTPIANLYTSGKLKTSKWIRSHMSDILRYATLWKFGGIYIDLDFIMMSDLKNMTDFASAESSEDVNSAFLGFSKSEIGRKVSSECLMHLKDNFRGDIWSANGPGVITEVMNKICNVKQLVAHFHLTVLLSRLING